jgi:hypothetical protein
MSYTLYNLEPENHEALQNKVPPDKLDQILQALEGSWKEQWGPMKPFLLVD